MKTTIKIILYLSLLAFLGCEKTTESNNTNLDNLIGSWVNGTCINSICTFKRADSLNHGEYGFSFEEKQLFIERKIAGWCATPPVSYVDYEGTWSNKDSVAYITVNSWRGTVNYKWKVVSVNNDSLKIIMME
jgi:hypothetical protein